jgi:hypothetical protein
MKKYFKKLEDPREFYCPKNSDEFYLLSEVNKRYPLGSGFLGSYGIKVEE